MHTRADLVRELDLLRGHAARGSGRPRVALTELARRVEVPRSTLHTYVTGATLPPVDVLDRIVLALGGSAVGWADAWDRVAAHEHQARRAPGPPTAGPPRQLPPDVPAFTGRRAELVALDRLLAGSRDTRTGRAVVVSAIAGTAGVGKTALAVHWAHRVADRFPDGHLHLNLRGYDPDAPLTAPDAAAALLRGLGVADADVPPTLDERAGRLRGLLDGRRVLLVLDNASSAEQVRHLLPATSSCFTLITSRDTLAGLTVREGAHRLDLDVLPMTESVALLRQLLGERVDYEHADAEALARLCARLPLALRIAAELARSGPGAPLRDLVRELADEGRRLTVLDSSADPRSMVRAVFSWSYRQLPAEGAELFRLLGCHPGGDFDTRTAAALVGGDLADAARRLDLLVRANLVQARGGGRYDLHDLLRDYSRELAAATPAEEVRAATSRLVDHYVTTAATAVALVYPALLGAEAVAGSWLTDEADARSWLTAETDNVVAVVDLAAAGGLTGQAARLARLMARHFETTARWRQGRTMHERARDAARTAGDLAGVATATRNLGIMAESLGDHEQALEHFEHCVELWREIGDRNGLAATYSSIGITLDSLSRFDEAVDAYRRSLELSSELGDRQAMTTVQLNLGVVFEQRRDHERAGENFRQALAGFLALGDRLGEAHARTNLGNVLILRDEHDQAFKQFGLALDAYRELGSRLGEAFALKGLGVVLVHRGDLACAIDRYTDALAITEEVDDVALRGEVLNLLAHVLRASGEPDRARAVHEDALAVARAHNDRLEEANARHGLGLLAHDAGRTAQARRHWQRALALYEELRVPQAEELCALLSTSGV